MQSGPIGKVQSPMITRRTMARLERSGVLRSRQMHGQYPCGGVRRRDFLGSTALLSAAGLIAGTELVSAQEPSARKKAGASRPEEKLGVPGPYPGRVIEVKHPGLVQGDH